MEWLKYYKNENRNIIFCDLYSSYSFYLYFASRFWISSLGFFICISMIEFQISKIIYDTYKTSFINNQNFHENITKYCNLFFGYFKINQF